MKQVARTLRTSSGFRLGRQSFAKISAVEGIRLTPEMEAQFRNFDRQNLSPEERRRAIALAFGGGQS